MSSCDILFDEQVAVEPETITERIAAFGDKYNEATKDIIRDSRELDKDGKAFIKCASRILSSFGMTRSGPFKGAGIAGKTNKKKILSECWDAIGDRLLEVNKSVLENGLSRDRYLLELSESERAQLIAKVWLMTKQLLPFTMGKTSHGLVGASKILFSVLPEIALPIDNAQWTYVFQTVDLGDVISRMVSDIQRWEQTTGRQLNELDDSKRLTTLPSVYNVMAMYARPRLNGIKKKGI
jgi:hypothetical protein